MDLNYQYCYNNEANLPPGFRFHPTDEELITYYLLKKVFDSNFTSRAIAEADLNKCEPWHLPGKAKMGETEWYFFSLQDRKYPTGLRTNRATETGYWKATGKDREIYSSKTCAMVGMKKTLVFYRGRAPKGEKSNWVMHEYRLDGKLGYQYLCRNSEAEWVISRVFQKTATAAVVAGGKKLSSACSGGAIMPSPELIPSSVSRTQCGGVVSAKEHVPCFSIAAPPSFFDVPPPPPLAALIHDPSAPAICLQKSGVGVGVGVDAGAPGFPILKSLQENLHLPVFAPAVPLPPMCVGADLISGYGPWFAMTEEKIRASEFDCIWNY